MELWRHIPDTHTHARNTCVHVNASAYPAAARLHVHVRRRVLHDYARELPTMQIDPSGRRWNPFRWQECSRVDAIRAYVYLRTCGVPFVCVHMNRHIVYSTACTDEMCASQQANGWERKREKVWGNVVLNFLEKFPRQSCKCAVYIS